MQQRGQPTWTLGTRKDAPIGLLPDEPAPFMGREGKESLNGPATRRERSVAAEDTLGPGAAHTGGGDEAALAGGLLGRSAQPHERAVERRGAGNGRACPARRRDIGARARFGELAGRL